MPKLIIGHRSPRKHSAKRDIDVERFAYDVFAYMLRICGFPEEAIPTSSLKENNYNECDFVKNAGLSALPIALYKRDEWRTKFEIGLVKGIFCNIHKIKYYLSSFIEFSDDLEDEDTLSKIQHSIALYNEFALFLNSKGIKTYFDNFPKQWSCLCKQLIAESEDSDETLEYALTMCPDVSESWIADFIRNFATPYENSGDVSDRFSLHTLECHSVNDTCLEKTSTETIAKVWPEKSVKPSDPMDTKADFPEDVSSGSSLMACDWSSFFDSELRPGENSPLEIRAYGIHTNGLNYVLKECLNRKKRSRSQKVEVEDAFGEINLGEENISPENIRIKRRRTASGKDAAK